MHSRIWYGSYFVLTNENVKLSYARGWILDMLYSMKNSAMIRSDLDWINIINSIKELKSSINETIEQNKLIISQLHHSRYNNLITHNDSYAISHPPSFLLSKDNIPNDMDEIMNK